MVQKHILILYLNKVSFQQYYQRGFVMRIKNIDLIITLSIATLNVIWNTIPNRPQLVGMIFALPLTFILPGYTLTQTLIRHRSPGQPPETHTFKHQPSLKKGRPPGGVDVLALSLGLSLAVDVLVGFMLNVLPVGLQTLSWALSLGLFITICALLAAFFRRRDMPQVTKAHKLRMTKSDGIPFGLAILVATAAIWFAMIRPIEPQPSFTQFWMLPASSGSKSCAVSIGVRNFEVTPVTYHVMLMVNSFEAGTWSSITLAPEREWVQSALVTPQSATSVRVEAQLYREDKPGILYRDVHLTFYIATGGKNGQTQQQCTL
jgi:uncharacterized membrane protein